MAHLEITNNSEKYIKLLQQRDKISINSNDIKASDYLIKRCDPLCGYYNVKSFTINNKQIDSCELFPNYRVLCGDCYNDECFLLKRIINKTI